MGLEGDVELLRAVRRVFARRRSARCRRAVEDLKMQLVELDLQVQRVRRELADADPARTLELQATLARIRTAIENLASAQPMSR